jgi:hypothetical protein
MNQNSAGTEDYINLLVVNGLLTETYQRDFTVRTHEIRNTDSPVLCRFSDAGNDRRSAHSGGRRLKSAKARSREKWRAGRAASAMGI